MTVLPLAGVRVVDAVEEKGELCGRLLADLGADVVRVGGPNGDEYAFAIRNYNKRAAAADQLDALLAGSDVYLTSSPPTTSVLQDHPHLVVTAITDFGLTGPYRDYRATNAVMVAMGGMLFRSGTPDRPPLLPPGLLAYDVAGITARGCDAHRALPGATAGRRRVGHGVVASTHRLVACRVRHRRRSRSEAGWFGAGVLDLSVR